jgi:GNAT superfamily N-acetyltransferase
VPDFTLRTVPYHHPDAAALTAAAQQFYVELYGGPDSAPVDRSEFAAPHGHFLVGYLDEEPVTMGGWRFSDVQLAEMTRPAELKRMFVRADVRRLGLAIRTLHALEDSAAAAGADWLILEAGLPQVAALAFYRAAGYGDIPRFGYYADYPNSVSLGRPLTGASISRDPAGVLP